MNVEASNLSHAEFYRLNGALSAERCETLIDAEADLEQLIDASTHIDEASGCFVSEDFLSGVLSDMRALAKKVRGGNKFDLEQLIERLEEIESEEARNAEYGRDELRKLSNVFPG